MTALERFQQAQVQAVADFHWHAYWRGEAWARAWRDRQPVVFEGVSPHLFAASGGGVAAPADGCA